MRTPLGRLAAFAVTAMLLSIPVAAAAQGEGPAAAPKAPAVAKGGEKPQEGTQQNRMKVCNEQAAKKSLRGEERRAFMSACLRRH